MPEEAAMKKVLSAIISIAVIAPSVVFAKGGGTGNLMHERIVMAYSAGQISMIAVATTTFVIGIAVGFFAGRRTGK